MICYILVNGEQHLGPHEVVGYGIKIFGPGLFITSPGHLDRIDCAIYLIISKLEQGGCRIRSRRQNEDEWRTAVGISKCFAKVKRWWLNKPLSKLSGNKVLDCGRHLK